MALGDAVKELLFSGVSEDNQGPVWTTCCAKPSNELEFQADRCASSFF